MLFERFPQTWSHINEKEKFVKKNDILQKKWSGDTVDRYLFQTFIPSVSEKRGFMGGGTND